MSKPRVFNLAWLAQPPEDDQPTVVVARHEKSTVSKQKNIGVVILYPALATPEILVGASGKLELILLTQTMYTTAELKMRIRRQLKVTAGFDPHKWAAGRALFVDANGSPVGSAAEQVIEVEKIDFGVKTLIKSHSGRFSGFIDKRAHTFYTNEGYKHLYRVSMSSKVLAAAMGEEHRLDGEPQDLLIKKLLDKRSKWAKQKDSNYYCFTVNRDDLDCTAFDFDDPVQSYHPVFHYQAGEWLYPNFCHLTDVHLAARQQVLAKTRARVIDNNINADDGYLQDSPFIGDMVNVCSADMMSIMNGMLDGGKWLLIGGDLVDFLRSSYMSPAVAKMVRHGKPAEVWNAVGLGDNYTDYYKDGPDMIGFYSILVKYCRRNAMPAFAISGNHDCYHLPYGLSPRIDIGLAERRANEGIPSDHNLTFYEAILAFGETYRKLMSGLKSPFDPDLFDWFYMVFTPFCDFSVELPNQHLVAIGWGDTEDLLDFPGTGHGFGHLPRAKDAIVDRQRDLLSAAFGQKRVLLMTHFTFVSYDYSIPLNQGESDPGDVYISYIKDYSKYNFGTFMENRKQILGDYCTTDRKMQIVLTGHSHRRALYLMKEIDNSGRKSIKTLHFDFKNFEYAKKKYPEAMKTAIVVSDSGGTIPRFNQGGEFNGHGSDPPSGTMVLFNQQTGEIDRIDAIRAHLRPRVAVAIDYVDIQDKNTVVVKFSSDRFKVEDEKQKTLTKIIFQIELQRALVIRGFFVSLLSFHLKWGPKSAWRRIHLTRIGGTQQFQIGQDDIELFTEYFAKNESRGNFLSLTFGEPPQNSLKRYDFSSPWCWEFQVDFETFGFGKDKEKLYKIERDRKRAEIPDFSWRRNNVAYKYK